MIEAADPLDRAERLLARRAYRDAHSVCMAVLGANPRAARAWFLLGVLTADHNNLERAAELFEKAAAFDERDPKARAQLARCKIALNRQGEALAWAEAAAKLGQLLKVAP